MDFREMELMNRRGDPWKRLRPGIRATLYDMASERHVDVEVVLEAACLLFITTMRSSKSRGNVNQAPASSRPGFKSHNQTRGGKISAIGELLPDSLTQNPSERNNNQ
jgi:hypothetical protein